MGRTLIKLSWLRVYTQVLLVVFLMSGVAYAQPFSKGKFGANVAFGSQTSLSIATTGNVTINMTPTSGAILGTATNTVTVTSTDVVGYKLYIMANSSSNLVNGSNNIPASSNITPAVLATNTWGYNIDGSSNFAGITTSNVLVKSATGPYTAGDNTTFTYGAKLDITQPSGTYLTTVNYTAAPQTD